MSDYTGIGTIYLKGWQSLRKNWKVLILTYGMNLLLAFIAIGPLSNLLAFCIGHTTIGEQLSSTFDYTLITEIMRHEGNALNISLAAVSSFFLLYIPWTVFYQGGYMAMIRQQSRKALLRDFWRGGATYFFRFLRLSLYVLGVTFVIISILYKLLVRVINPLDLYSEGPLIKQFWISIIFFLVISFFISIFKELAKNLIAASDKPLISGTNILALRSTLKWRAIGLSLLNLLVLLMAVLLYCILRKLIGSYLIPAIIVGQLFLIFRLAYKYVRLASFYHHLKPETTA